MAKAICSNSTAQRFESGSRRIAAAHSAQLLKREEASPLIRSRHSRPSSAGWRICTIICCTNASGRRRRSRIGVQQWMIFRRTGVGRPDRTHFQSCTCFYTRWNSLSAIDFSDEPLRPRSSPITISSRLYSTSSISTVPTMNPCAFAALSQTLHSVPCSPCCSSNFYFF